MDCNTGLEQLLAVLQHFQYRPQDLAESQGERQMSMQNPAWTVEVPYVLENLKTPNPKPETLSRILG